MLDEKTRNVNYTDEGNEFLEVRLVTAGLLPEEQSLYDPESTTLVHHVNQGLRAHKLFEKDKDYIVRDGEVVLIDGFFVPQDGPCIIHLGADPVFEAVPRADHRRKISLFRRLLKQRIRLRRIGFEDCGTLVEQLIPVAKHMDDRKTNQHA